MQIGQDHEPPGSEHGCGSILQVAWSDFWQYRTSRVEFARLRSTGEDNCWRLFGEAF